MLPTPFWFKQRQCKQEFVGPDEQMLKVSGPNLAEAYIYARPENSHWRAGLKMTPDGPDVATSEAESAKLAWEAAFELYRTHVIS
jgi:hypothetical protein